MVELFFLSHSWLKIIQQIDISQFREEDLACSGGRVKTSRLLFALCLAFFLSSFANSACRDKSSWCRCRDGEENK